MCTVLLDVDDVLADCSQVVHKFAESLFDRILPGPETWYSYEFAEGMGLSDVEKDLFEAVCLKASFPWDIDLYHGAEEFVKDLQDAGLDICFVTKPWAGLNCWVPAREALLGSRFPGVDVVYTGAKERVKGDLLLDDSPHNLRKNADRAVAYHRAWNKSVSVPRAHDYKEARAIVLAKFELLKHV